MTNAASELVCKELNIKLKQNTILQISRTNNEKQISIVKRKGKKNILKHSIIWSEMKLICETSNVHVRDLIDGFSDQPSQDLSHVIKESQITSLTKRCSLPKSSQYVTLCLSIMWAMVLMAYLRLFRCSSVK